MLENRSRWAVVVMSLALTQVGFRCDIVRPVLNEPTSSSPIAVDHDDSNVWVVNPDSDTIGKINVASGQLVDEISVGDNPRTLALSRYFGHSRVYVANQDSDTVTRFNDSRFWWFRRNKTAHLPRGSAPYGVAITPDGKTLLVTLERTHQLAFVSPSTMKVLEVIDVPRTPRGIAIAGAGDVAYLSHFITFEPLNSSVVTEIDIATRSIVRTIELPPDFETCETDASGQGVTNLCSTIVLPPTGSPPGLANTVWLGCQRSNNIDKGLLSRSTTMGGTPFPEDNFVGRSRNIFKASFHDIIRSIMVRVNLNTEVVDYIDIDDGGLATGIGFSPDGNTG